MSVYCCGVVRVSIVHWRRCAQRADGHAHGGLFSPMADNVGVPVALSVPTLYQASNRKPLMIAILSHACPVLVTQRSTAQSCRAVFIFRARTGEHRLTLLQPLR